MNLQGGKVEMQFSLFEKLIMHYDKDVMTYIKHNFLKYNSTENFFFSLNHKFMIF